MVTYFTTPKKRFEKKVLYKKVSQIRISIPPSPKPTLGPRPASGGDRGHDAVDELWWRGWVGGWTLAECAEGLGLTGVGPSRDEFQTSAFQVGLERVRRPG